MVFSSYLFIFLFLPIFLSLYQVVPASLKNAFILVASLAFYYYGDHAGTWVLLCSVIGNYAFGRCIAATRADAGETAATPPLAKRWLIGGIVFNLGVLAYFKYIGFLTRNVNTIGAWLGHPDLTPVIDAALPLGISFFRVPGHQLSDRRLPRHHRREPQPAAVRDLQDAVPATDRRTHRALQGRRRRPARAQCRRCATLRGNPAFRDRFLQEGPDCRYRSGDGPTRSSGCPRTSLRSAMRGSA